MLVKALDRGFVNRLIEPGETFEIQDEQFSSRWMEKVEGGASAPPEPNEEAPKRRGRPKKEG
jgi:hypothetical protein